MQLSIKLATGILSASLLVSISAANPTTIDFSNLIGSVSDYGQIPDGYGSFAANTPDVAVSYSTNSGEPQTPISEVLYSYLSFWQGEYGDLPAVAYPTTSPNYGVVALTPNAGYSVTLDSFRIAGYPTGEGSELGQSIGVDNGSFQIFSPSVNYYPTDVPHSGDLLFTPNITSTGTLNIIFGPSWNIGINDITFSEQPVAAPDAASSALLLGAAFLALAVFSPRLRLSGIR